MSADEERISDIIHELDDFINKAEELKTGFGYMLDRHQLYSEEAFKAIGNETYKLARIMRETSDNLKRSRATWVKECVADWHRGRMDDEEGIEDPEFESVNYEGNNKWVLIMSTPTHGRERVVIEGCDGTNWPGVYSALRF